MAMGASLLFRTPNSEFRIHPSAIKHSTKMTSTVSIEQLVALNDEIASLVRGGMPLELGLRELGEDSAGALQQITQALASRMSNGATLAEALDGERQRL